MKATKNHPSKALKKCKQSKNQKQFTANISEDKKHKNSIVVVFPTSTIINAEINTQKSLEINALFDLTFIHLFNN